MQTQSRVRPLSVWWPASQIDVGVYVVEGCKRGLIDTAAPGAHLLEALGKIGLNPADIDMVLNTHGHPDHTGGNAVIKAGGKAEICIHRSDTAFVEEHERCFDEFYAPVTNSLLGPEAVVKQREDFVYFLGPDLVVDRALEDGDLVDLGDGVILRVIHLPGHTPGSVGFLLEEDGILIAGDSTPGLNAPGGSLPVILDIEAYRASLEHLLELQVSTLHTAHPFRGVNAPPKTVREGDEVEAYFRESLEFTDLLQTQLKRQVELASDRSLVEIADDVIGGLPSELGFKSIGELPMPDMSLVTVFWNTRQSAG